MMDIVAKQNLSRSSNIANGGASAPPYGNYITGFLNDASYAIDRFNSVASANSALSASEARIQRDWQEVQNAKAMAFNAAEAAKNRDWQAMMSNTAHQREVADLKAAGLNPVLSAMNGNGASVGSGATASGVTSAGAKGDVDMSGNSAIVSLLSSLLNYKMNMDYLDKSTAANLAITERNNATSALMSEISAAATRAAAGMSAGAVMYSADRSKEANQEVAKLNAQVNRYKAQLDYLGYIYGADSSAGSARYSADRAYESSHYSSDKSYAASIYGSKTAGQSSRYNTDESTSASERNNIRSNATNLFTALLESASKLLF